MNNNDEPEIKYTPPKRWSQYLLVSSCSLIGLGIILSAFLRIDEVITSRGKIENTGSIKSIKSTMDGNILEIYVKEGQKVKKNNVLIKLEDEIYQYQEDSLKNKIKELEIEKEINKEILKRYIILEKEGASSELNIYNSKVHLKLLSMNGMINIIANLIILKISDI